jgi:tetratricopeptide (TPR) repeat protein
LVLVHRLVQVIARAQLTPDAAGQWKQASAALVEAAVPADPQLPAAWPVYAAMLPHALAVLDLTSDGMWKIALYLGHSGNYAAAQDLFQRIADAHAEDDDYGPEHIRERVLGPEHPDTLTIRHELTRSAGQAGAAARARDQFAALLPTMEQVEGPEHPHILTARYNLAFWTGEAGDAARARDQFAALLPIRERVQGPEHPHILNTRHELARWTGEAGDAAGARDQFAVLLPIMERVRGSEHPHTLITRTNLTYWTGKTTDSAHDAN